MNVSAIAEEEKRKKTLDDIIDEYEKEGRSD